MRKKITLKDTLLNALDSYDSSYLQKSETEGTKRSKAFRQEIKDCKEEDLLSV